MRNYTRITQFSDNAIGEIARALARSAGEQNRVRDLQRMMQPFAQRDYIIVQDAKTHRFASQLPHGVRPEPARSSRKPSPAASVRRVR